MVKTYIPAPDFSTAPPPKGPIDLGHILKTLDELVPLNRKSRVAIPDDDLVPVDEKLKFRTSRGELLKGQMGLFARFFALSGVGFDASGSYEKEMEDILTVEKLETIAFIPSDRYIKQSMEATAVKMYLEDSKYKAPVYIVTGLKIARGASVENKVSRSRGGKLSMGINPPTAPIEVGPSGEFSKTKSAGVSFQSSSDFVVGVRVRKVRYRASGITHSLYKTGATMEGDGPYTEPFEVLGLGSDPDIEDFESSASLIDLNDDELSADTEEVCWIMPKLAESRGARNE